MDAEGESRRAGCRWLLWPYGWLAGVEGGGLEQSGRAGAEIAAETQQVREEVITGGSQLVFFFIHENKL